MIISDYIEAISNPNGRFKTLETIYPLTDNHGEPLMTVTDESIDFEVIYNSHRYTLHCLIVPEQQKDHYRSISIFTQLIESDYITDYVFYPQEMIVFDNFAKPHPVCVVLEKRPTGQPFEQWARAAAFAGNTGLLMNFIRNLANMCVWMKNNDYSHGNLTHVRLFVDPAGNPVMTDYRRATRIASNSDTRMAGRLAISLYIAACYPQMWDHYRRTAMRSKAGRTRIAHSLAEAMAAEPITAFTEIINACICSEDYNTGEICRLMEELSFEGPVKYLPLDDVDRNLRLAGEYERKSEHEPAAGVIRYDEVGDTSNPLFMVKDLEGNYYFTNGQGKKYIERKFRFATDFSGGRAVVETERGYGLIDENNNDIIRPVHCDIEWMAEIDLAFVTLNGRAAIFSRDGRNLTGFVYDAICGEGDGLICVGRDGKYGYLNLQLEPVIPLVYDEAYSFRDGIASVKRKDRTFYIDRRGTETGEVVLVTS